MAYNLIESWITPNYYSRPEYVLITETPKGIVIHWVANPMSSAIANRNFFENRKYGNNSYGSAHEIINLDGDIVLCIPENEMAYHVGSSTYTDKALEKLSDYPNDSTYGIECTHIDWDGLMTEDSYNTLVERCADLCIKWNLKAGVNGDIWLHYEVVGWKDCHRYFVNNTDKWHEFLNEVQDMIDYKTSVEEKSWEQKHGEESIDNLHAKGLLDSPEDWKSKDLKNEMTPLWLFFEMIDRTTDE